MTDLTSTAKKIMEVFCYYRIHRDGVLSTRLLITKRHLWRDIEEEQFNEAIEDLTREGYIAKMGNPEGWRLLELGAEYIRNLERRY